jgi:hypothetical protein
MRKGAKKTTLTAQERQLRIAIPPAVWADLIDYQERNAHDSLVNAVKELIRQALVRERQEAKNA